MPIIIETNVRSELKDLIDRPIKAGTSMSAGINYSGISGGQRMANLTAAKRNREEEKKYIANAILNVSGTLTKRAVKVRVGPKNYLVHIYTANGKDRFIVCWTNPRNFIFSFVDLEKVGSKFNKAEDFILSKGGDFLKVTVRPA